MVLEPNQCVCDSIANAHNGLLIAWHESIFMVSTIHILDDEGNCNTHLFFVIDSDITSNLFSYEIQLNAWCQPTEIK